MKVKDKTQQCINTWPDADLKLTVVHVINRQIYNIII